MEVSLIRAIAFGGLYWGTLLLGNYVFLGGGTIALYCGTLYGFGLASAS